MAALEMIGMERRMQNCMFYNKNHYHAEPSHLKLHYHPLIELKATGT